MVDWEFQSVLVQNRARCLPNMGKVLSQQGQAPCPGWASFLSVSCPLFIQKADHLFVEIKLHVVIPIVGENPLYLLLLVFRQFPRPRVVSRKVPSVAHCLDDVVAYGLIVACLYIAESLFESPCHLSLLHLMKQFASFHRIRGRQDTFPTQVPLFHLSDDMPSRASLLYLTVFVQTMNPIVRCREFSLHEIRILDFIMHTQCFFKVYNYIIPVLCSALMIDQSLARQ